MTPCSLKGSTKLVKNENNSHFPSSFCPSFFCFTKSVGCSWHCSSCWLFLSSLFCLNWPVHRKANARTFCVASGEICKASEYQSVFPLEGFWWLAMTTLGLLWLTARYCRVLLPLVKLILSTFDVHWALKAVCVCACNAFCICMRNTWWATRTS